MGVAEAPFLSLESWKMATFLVGSEATLGSRGRCRQARSVLQGPAVWAWRRRRKMVGFSRVSEDPFGSFPVSEGLYK